MISVDSAECQAGCVERFTSLTFNSVAFASDASLKQSLTLGCSSTHQFLVFKVWDEPRGESEVQMCWLDVKTDEMESCESNKAR